MVSKMSLKYGTIEKLIFIIIVGFCFPIALKASIASSGTIPIYLSDFAFAALALLTVKIMLKRKYRLHTLEGICFYFFMIISIWYLIATIYRYVTGYGFYKSFAAFYRSAVPVCFGAAILGDNNQKRIIAISNIGLSIVFLLKIITDLYWNSTQNDFLINRNVVVYVAVITLFLSEMVWHIHVKTKFLAVCSIANTSYSILFLLISGSRLGAYALIVALVCILLAWRDKIILKRYLVCFGIAAIFLGIILYTDFSNSRYYISRSFNLNTISKSIEVVDNLNLADKEIMEDFSEEIALDDKKTSAMTQDEILVANDSGRFVYWIKGIEKIKMEPLFGTGELSVSVSKEFGGQAPHNFLLEYSIIYGLVGLSAWTFFVLMYIFISLKKMSIPYVIMFISALGLALGMAFFQPFLCTGICPFITWLLLFLLSGSTTIEEPDNAV